MDDAKKLNIQLHYKWLLDVYTIEVEKNNNNNKYN